MALGVLAATTFFWSPLNQPKQILPKVLDPGLATWPSTKLLVYTIPFDPTGEIELPLTLWSSWVSNLGLAFF